MGCNLTVFQAARGALRTRAPAGLSMVDDARGWHTLWTSGEMTTGTVRPSASARSLLRPLESARVRIVDGFFAERQRVNRDRTIPHGFSRAGFFPV